MRHKLISSRWKLTMFVSSMLLTLNTVVFGVPLSMSYSNQDTIKNENFAQEKRDNKKLADSNCIVNGSKYGEGEHVPGAGPCEECICKPPNVVCSMMKCPINSGCITIQLPNKCCPKYKCDCEHKGKLYNNGEKVSKSDESPCRVCFCNGGEIVCTSIVCYTRNDCQGYYLPGDCCPKYDNCSSTLIEQKLRESINNEKSTSRNIQFGLFSTEQNLNEDSIWKRDTTIQKQEFTDPSIITMPSTVTDVEKISRSINKLPNKFLEELDVSTASSIQEYKINLDDPNDEINTLHNLVTDITVDSFNITGDSKTSFLGFETDNSTTINEDATEPYLIVNNKTSEIPQFEELFDPTIDTSVVITLQNGTETVIGITDSPDIEEMFNASTEMTTSTQVEVFNPSDLISETKEPMSEFSTITSEVDVTTEMDYDESREATTPRAPDKSTIGTPHKLVVDSSQKIIEDEVNTEIAFTNLEDTADMFGPNFDYQTYKTQTQNTSNNLDEIDSQITKINYATTFLPSVLTNSENIIEITPKSSQNEFNTSIINSNKNSIDNNNSVNTEYKTENVSIKTNKAYKMYNDVNLLEKEKKNNTSCVDKICSDNLKLKDELIDSHIESTTPFIIEAKVLPNQVSPPLNKILYPKEYPEEFETIQNGPSLTITKRTYTSIPDIVYTTTTMVTLPTLDLIYKAEKDVENYFTQMQSTTMKPSNSLNPLQNISFFHNT